MVNVKLFIAPSFRFIVELTTWIWLLLYKWYLLPLSLICLGMLNFPGDKKPKGMKSPGIHVPGFVRITVEIGSAALGVYAAYSLFGFIGLILQILLSFISFTFDFTRWLWMLGFRDVPSYVKAVHKSEYQGSKLSIPLTSDK